MTYTLFFGGKTLRISELGIELTPIYRNSFTQNELKETIFTDVATMKAAMVQTAYSVAQKELRGI